jgi:hypothetical protein
MCVLRGVRTGGRAVGGGNSAGNQEIHVGSRPSNTGRHSTQKPQKRSHWITSQRDQRKSNAELHETSTTKVRRPPAGMQVRGRANPQSRSHQAPAAREDTAHQCRGRVDNRPLQQASPRSRTTVSFADLGETVPLLSTSYMRISQAALLSGEVCIIQINISSNTETGSATANSFDYLT